MENAKEEGRKSEPEEISVMGGGALKKDTLNRGSVESGSALWCKH